MIVDSSALVAILKEEPDGRRFLIQLMDEREAKDAATVVDANRSSILSRRFDNLISGTDIVIEPVAREQEKIARAACRDFVNQ